MTVILPFGRMLTRQVLPRSNQLLTRLASSNSILRASCSESDKKGSAPTSQGIFPAKGNVSGFRTYATEAAKKPVGRPKAHTGRTAAKKPTAKTKSTAATPKATTKPRSKAKAKSRAKPRAKPKKRVVKKVAKKPQSKTAVYNARLARTKDLKAKALLSEPKQLPSNAWALYFSREQKKTHSASIAESSAKTKEIAREFKTVAPEDLEQLNHTAHQNKTKNESEYKKWVSQFSPSEIKGANEARKALNKEAKAAGKKKAPCHLIKDHRLVKRPVSSFAYFTIDRHASQDFRHMALAEATRLVGREWKQLSASEKKPYEDKAETDRDRYQ